MTFSPDASFPVINIEKGRIGGNFTAEFEPSDQSPEDGILPQRNEDRMSFRAAAEASL